MIIDLTFYPICSNLNWWNLYICLWLSLSLFLSINLFLSLSFSTVEWVHTIYMIGKPFSLEGGLHGSSGRNQLHNIDVWSSAPHAYLLPHMLAIGNIFCGFFWKNIAYFGSFILADFYDICSKCVSTYWGYNWRNSVWLSQFCKKRSRGRGIER